MNGLLKNKVAIAAGSHMQIITSITRTFLEEGATVIVPAKSAGEIDGLKESLANINAEKLITLITDYPDYYNAFNVAETIMEEFGKIDIAVLCFKQLYSSSVITETNIMEWEKMIDENISAYFVGARIVFNCMKNNSEAMFVSICQKDIVYHDAHNGLAALSSLVQKKLALMFYAEFKKAQIRFHNIVLLSSKKNSISNITNPDKLKMINAPRLNDYLLHLYQGETENTDESFHSFIENDVANS